jgi:hypothetical protein
VEKLIKYLLRRGLRDGLFGGDRRWVVLGALALVARMATRAARHKPEVVFSEQLGVGERLIIAHSTRTGHNGRRESPAPQP